MNTGTGVHISKIVPLTATAIAEAKLWDDPYHRVIKNAALVLQQKGKGHWEYFTQWSSGTTLWQGPQGKTLSVSEDGVISLDEED